MKAIASVLFAFVLLVVAAPVAQGAPEVGRAAAAKYFGRRAPAEDGVSTGSLRPSDHYLALHFGRFMDAPSWRWGQEGRENTTGVSSYGLTYRLNEWNNSMDLNLRVDFNEYDVAGERPLKMSLMPLLTFPDATSRFPLYFGAGAGLGVFFKQIEGESPLAFDYQLFMGARFFDVFNNAGFFVETGMKNHLLLISDGQFNGVFLTGGAVFTF